MRDVDDHHSTNRPSQTALRVAALRDSFVRLPSEFGDPSAESRLVAALLARAPIVEPPQPTEYGRRFLAYLARRTEFFDALTTDAIHAGIDQIVIVAAGYDGRAMRYAAPGVTFYEIDHPDTQRDKRELLDSLGITTIGTEYVAVDLTSGSARTALSATSHDRTRPSAFLIEGLAVYVPAGDLARLFVDLREASAAGSRIGVSYPGRADAGVGRAALAMRVASLGEPIRADLSGAEFLQMLAGAGWQLLVTEQASPNLITATAG